MTFSTLPEQTVVAERSTTPLKELLSAYTLFSGSAAVSLLCSYPPTDRPCCSEPCPQMDLVDGRCSDAGVGHCLATAGSACGSVQQTILHGELLHDINIDDTCRILIYIVLVAAVVVSVT